jgi:hypothetical protein
MQMLLFYDGPITLDNLLGAIFVEADDIDEAVELAWRLGINPGGTACMCELDPEKVPEGLETNTFLAVDELLERGLVLPRVVN